MFRAIQPRFLSQNWELSGQTPKAILLLPLVTLTSVPLPPLCPFSLSSLGFHNGQTVGTQWALSQCLLMMGIPSPGSCLGWPQVEGL